MYEDDDDVDEEEMDGFLFLLLPWCLELLLFLDLFVAYPRLFRFLDFRL